MLDKNFIILDGLLSEEELRPIKDLLDLRKMPFYWHEDIDYDEGGSDQYNFGFSHQLFNKYDNTYSSFVDSYSCVVVNACSRVGVEFDELLRMRLVLLTNVGVQHRNRPHVDLKNTPDYMTLVYYPEDTDGNFVVLSPDGEHEIEPKANRCIVMPKPILHHGAHPMTHKRRIVLNANITVQ